MEYESARNPIWANEEKTAINLFVNFKLFGDIPFTAASYDTEKHGRVIFEKAKQGYFGKVSDFVPIIVSYTELRAAEYPPIGDQLDAIMKWLSTENEFTVPTELKSLAMKCMSVKAKYPKPEE